MLDAFRRHQLPVASRAGWGQLHRVEAAIGPGRGIADHLHQHLAVERRLQAQGQVALLLGQHVVGRVDQAQRRRAVGAARAAIDVDLDLDLLVALAGEDVGVDVLSRAVVLATEAEHAACYRGDPGTALIRLVGSDDVLVGIVLQNDLRIFQTEF